jgi:hypothetical protein
MRRFEGTPWTWEIFKDIALELYRITAPGGVVCWIVQDQVIDKNVTGTKYRQALFFKEIGFDLYQELYMLSVGGWKVWPKRYHNQVHLCLVFSKGNPSYVRLLKDRKNKYPLKVGKHFQVREKDGSIRTWINHNPGKLSGHRTNVWSYPVGYGQAELAKLSSACTVRLSDR